MITRLQISNFRSLGQDVDVRLGNLTALVGPNGSGKSNVCDALRFVSDALRLGLDSAITLRGGIDAVRRWSAGRPFDVRMEIKLELDGRKEHKRKAEYAFALADAKGAYRVKREEATIFTSGFDLLDPRSFSHGYIVENGQWQESSLRLQPSVDALTLVLPLVAGDTRLRPLAKALRSIEVYSIFPDTLREPQKVDPARPMHRHGANWCSVLRGLKEEAWAPEMRAALGRLTGDIEDVRVKQVGGYLVTEFRHSHQDDSGGGRREKWFDAAQESDGTLRFAGILTALLQEPALTLIGVEEPELTVHSGALPLLFDYLKQASTRSQVLITTHSPELVDLFDADDIRVVERIDGVTRVSPLEESQRETVRRRLLTLSELARMEGLRSEPRSTEPERESALEN